MTNSKLIDALEDRPRPIVKYTLYFCAEKLDINVLNYIKFYLGTKSNSRAIESVFATLASDEINKEKKSILRFGGYGCASQLSDLSVGFGKKSKVSIPAHILLATSKLIDGKPPEAESIESIINYLMGLYQDKIKYYWNPEVAIKHINELNQTEDKNKMQDAQTVVN